MAKLRDVIGDREVQKSDWYALADAWGVLSDYTMQGVAPDGVTCKTCWDTHLCGECLGEYPDQCPSCLESSEGAKGKCWCQDEGGQDG